MRNNCLNMEELAGLAELPTPLPVEDPRCQHLEECPRCQAHLLTFQEFLAGEGSCDDQLLDRAMGQLGGDLDREIFGSEQATSLADPKKIIYWQSPLVRSALAVAAALLLFFAIEGLWEKPRLDQKLLRLDPSDLSEQESLQPVTEILDDGDVLWRWNPVAEADSYQIEILDSRFELLANLPVNGEPLLRMPASKLEEIVPQVGAYFWVVIALQNGDVILRSEPFVFRAGSD